MMDKVRGKFQVQSITRHAWSKSSVEVELRAVCNDGTPENERFHQATPSGTVKMVIDNPPAAEFFELGKFVYADFILAE
jgi:hypothetical protein